MPDEASFEMTEQAFLSVEDGPRVNPKDFEGLAVRFVMEPHMNRLKSKESGRPIYDEIPFVDIRIPGDKTSHIFRPANDLDKQKWPRHWEAYENNQSDPESGTPLREWPQITRGLVLELEHFNIRTVEQLANLSDTSIQNFMGIRAYITKAQAWIAAADEGGVASEQLAQELESRDAQLSLQAEEIKELRNAISKLEAVQDE